MCICLRSGHNYDCNDKESIFIEILNNTVMAYLVKAQTAHFSSQKLLFLVLYKKDFYLPLDLSSSSSSWGMKLRNWVCSPR